MTRGGPLTGSIVNSETGVVYHFRHFLFPNDASVSLYIQVIQANIFDFSKEDFGNSEIDSTPVQVSVACLGLDHIGSVFDVILEFRTAARNQADDIAADLRAGTIYSVKGNFCFSNDPSLIIYSPEYSPVPPDEALDIEHVFLENYRQRVENK